jgi:Fuc2NAc and GlcNAc transferase
MTALFPAPLILLPAAALSWLLLRELIPLLRRKMLDRPNARSSHTTPTPRGGGVVFVVVGSVLAAAMGWLWGTGWSGWIPLLCCPLALVGMLDDRFDLPASWRYGAQLLTAAALIAISPLPIPAWSWPLLLVGITAVINFVNFMDGLDGLVGLSCAVVLVSSLLTGSAAMAASLWPLIGALVGFLFWNWSPAKVFMGDVGSTFLGAVISGLVLQQQTAVDSLGLLLVAFPLLADALFCVLRRWRKGQPIFQAHRLHLFQRLHQAGWSHQRVAIVYAAATALLAAGRQLGGTTAALTIAAMITAIGITLDQIIAVPFAATSARRS